MKTLQDFEPQLEKALSYEPAARQTLKDVADKLLSGDAQWWLKGSGLVITEVLERDGHLGLNYWLAAGDMDDVLAQLPEIEEWARGRGCEYAVMTGRKGWIKILPKLGWSVEPTVNFSKRL